MCHVRFFYVKLCISNLRPVHAIVTTSHRIFKTTVDTLTCKDFQLMVWVMWCFVTLKPVRVNWNERQFVILDDMCIIQLGHMQNSLYDTIPVFLLTLVSHSLITNVHSQKRFPGQLLVKVWYAYIQHPGGPQLNAFIHIFMLRWKHIFVHKIHASERIILYLFWFVNMLMRMDTCPHTLQLHMCMLWNCISQRNQQ